MSDKENIKTFSRLAREERETHFSLTDDENMWNCYTNIPKDMRKLEKQGWVKVSEELYPDGTIMSMTFEAPRRALTFGKAVKAKREYTEDQLQEMRDRLALSRNKQLGKV